MQSSDSKEDPLYADPECQYLGGDPRADPYVPVAVEIVSNEVRIRPNNDEEPPLRYPQKSLRGVYYEEQKLGPEQAEYEEGVVIGEFENLSRPTVVLIVADPEDVEPNGFMIRLGFRNAYYAKLFAKRCHESFVLPPF